MDSTALYDLFRSDTRDLATPYLWSDVDIYSYINDAQDMFCRQQGGIADATSAVTQIAVTAGDVFAPISPRILKIRQVLDQDGRDIEILNFEDVQFGRTSIGDDYGQQIGYRLDDKIGPVRAVVVGIETNKLRLVQIPTENTTLKLIVYRMPLDQITGPAQTLEIDEQHHRHLLNWMKHLGHQKQDSQTYDRGQAAEFGAAFAEYTDKARAEREKREHKYRTTRYGGY